MIVGTVDGGSAKNEERRRTRQERSAKNEERRRTRQAGKIEEDEEQERSRRTRQSEAAHFIQERSGNPEVLWRARHLGEKREKTFFLSFWGR